MAASYWRRRAPARRRWGPRGLVAESRSVDVPVLAVLVAVALSVAGRADRRQRDPTRVVGEKGLLRHAVVVGRAPRCRGVAGGRGQAAMMEGEGGPRKGQAGGKTQRDGDSSHVASPDRCLPRHLRVRRPTVGRFLSVLGSRHNRTPPPGSAS